MVQQTDLPDVVLWDASTQWGQSLFNQKYKKYTASLFREHCLKAPHGLIHRRWKGTKHGRNLKSRRKPSETGESR